MVDFLLSLKKFQFLVYYEATSDVNAAIAREKQIKGWLRSKKITLIDSMNPTWKDLTEEWFEIDPDPDSRKKSAVEGTTN